MLGGFVKFILISSEAMLAFTCSGASSSMSLISVKLGALSYSSSSSLMEPSRRECWGERDRLDAYLVVGLALLVSLSSALKLMKRSSNMLPPCPRRWEVGWFLLDPILFTPCRFLVLNFFVFFSFIMLSSCSSKSASNIFKSGSFSLRATVYSSHSLLMPPLTPSSENSSFSRDFWLRWLSFGFETFLVDLLVFLSG